MTINFDLRRAEPADRAEPVGGRWRPGDLAELAVVGGQHSRICTSPQDPTIADGIEAVAVHQYRHRGEIDQAADRGQRLVASAETGADDEGAVALQVGQHVVVPTGTRQGATHVLARWQVGGVDTRTAEPDVTGPGPHGGAGAQQRRARHAR